MEEISNKKELEVALAGAFGLLAILMFMQDSDFAGTANLLIALLWAYNAGGMDE